MQKGLATALIFSKCLRSHHNDSGHNYGAPGSQELYLHNVTIPFYLPFPWGNWKWEITYINTANEWCWKCPCPSESKVQS